MPRQGLGHSSVDIYNMVTPGIDDPVWTNKNSGQIMVGYQQSRTNKLVQSQTFKTTWATNAAAVIPNDLFEAPDNSTTAQAITSNSAGAQVFIQQTVATTAGETYTYSAHVKKAANSFVLLMFSDGTTSRTAYFNAATGAVSNTSNILTTSFDKMDDDWVRVSITFQNTVTTSSSFVRIFSAAAAGSTGTGVSFQAGTELLYVWGAQLEENSEPSAYIVTTNAARTTTETLNDTSEIWDFDDADLMPEVDPDNDGVWEVPANVVLNGDYEELGSNLVTNGTFETDSNWTTTTGWTISGGTAICDGSQSANTTLVQQNGIKSVTLNIVNGKTYEVTFDVVVQAGVITYVEVASGVDSTNISSSGTYTKTITASSTNGRLTFAANSDFVGSIDNVTLKQVDPNDRWNLDNGWSISDGKLRATSTALEATQTNVFTTGNTYEITFTLDSIASGSVKIKAGTSTGTIRSSAGTYTQILDVAYGTSLVFDMHASGSCVIDNVTVKEYAITPLNV